MSSVEKYNDDELVPPSCLDKELFEYFLKHQTGHWEHLKVHKFQITPASLKGQHYCSVMFRVLIDYEYKHNGEMANDQISVIVKTIPEIAGSKKTLLEETNLFDSEITVYEKVLPKFEKILREAGDDIKFGPKCLDTFVYTYMEIKKRIILEDLTPKGYVVLRDRQVNFDETQMIYEKMAKFHAVSYKLIKSKTPGLFDNFDATCIVENFYRVDYIRDCIGHFIGILSSKPEYHKYIKFFKRLQKKSISSIQRIYKEYKQNRHSPQDAIYVLNHGDLHGNNVMFQYESSGSQALNDAKLLDFQGVFVGPIVFDLLYSQYMLLDADLRANHWDGLLQLYWYTFVKTLKQIGCDGPLPQWDTLQRQFRQHRYFEMFLFTVNLALYYGFRTGGELEPELILSSSEYCKKVYALPGYLQEVEKLLAKFERMGYFDDV